MTRRFGPQIWICDPCNAVILKDSLKWDKNRKKLVCPVCKTDVRPENRKDDV